METSAPAASVAPAEPEKPRDSRSARSRVLPSLVVLLATALALAGAAAVAGAVAAHEQRQFLPNDRPPTDYDAHITYAMDYARNSSEANDVVFMGDSTTMCAIRPVEIQHLTGLRAYSIASVGVIGIDGTGVICRTYLEHHPKPRLLVLGITPWALTVPLEKTGPIEVRRRFVRCYGSLDGGWGDPESIFDQAKRGGISIIGHLRGGTKHFADEPTPQRGNLTFNTLRKVVKEARGNWEYPGALLPDWKRPPGPADPYPLSAPVSPENAKWVWDVVRLARENNIPLLIRLTPVTPGAQPQDYAHIQSWASALESPGVAVSKPAVMVYDPTCFGNPLHLNGRGAQMFSAFLAGQISAMLQGHATSTSPLTAAVVAPDHSRPSVSFTCSPSPGTPGEGRGEGLSWNGKGPHPNPLPEYRERGQERNEW